MTTTSVPLSLFTGKAVTVQKYGPGVIIKVTTGRTPYWVELASGDGIRRCADYHLSEVEDSDLRHELEESHRNKREEAWSTFVLGATVTLDDRPGTFVVIDVPKGGRVNVARLGGDGNRYIKAFVSNLTKVDL
jgi:hypothetical protein